MNKAKKNKILDQNMKQCIEYNNKEYTKRLLYTLKHDKPNIIYITRR